MLLLGQRSTKMERLQPDVQQLREKNKLSRRNSKSWRKNHTQFTNSRPRSRPENAVVAELMITQLDLSCKICEHCKKRGHLKETCFQLTLGQLERC
jgi:sortase (surface protein transpeptidase)